jgi:hypothetical protein
MTYKTFKRLLADAADCESYEQYIAEVGGSLPDEFFDDGIADNDDVSAESDDANDKLSLIKRALNFVWDYSRDRSFAKLCELSALKTHAELYNILDIPRSSAQQWLAGVRTPPAYVMDTMAFAVLGVVLYPDEV